MLHLHRAPFSPFRVVMDERHVAKIKSRVEI